MKLIKISNDTNKKDLLKKIGVTKEGISILKDKMDLNLVYIKDIKIPAALILKQDALSVGADLAVHKRCITDKTGNIDALLIANDKQLKILSKKELSQPFELKEFSLSLKDFIYDKYPNSVKIMGVINANDDSFFEESRFLGKKAISKIEDFITNGVDIIDIGAVSSRPGSLPVSKDEELKRLKPIIDEIYKLKLIDKVDFSLDSYTPECIEYALDRGFNIVNDITALQNDEVAKIASKYGASVILMHMKGTPENMQKDPHYENVIVEINDFFAKRIEKAKSFGIEKLILDVGIGFGKNLRHNLLLIKHLEHFKHFGYELLIGASRKSLIDKIIPTPVKDRLPSTLALHLKAIENGASIVRCHDVKEHFQALKVKKAIDEVLL